MLTPIYQRCVLAGQSLWELFSGPIGTLGPVRVDRDLDGKLPSLLVAKLDDLPPEVGRQLRPPGDDVRE